MGPTTEIPSPSHVKESSSSSSAGRAAPGQSSMLPKKPFSWGNNHSTMTPCPKKKTLADIIAEEKETFRAGQVAAEDNHSGTMIMKTLAEMEEEQARLLRQFTTKQQPTDEKKAETQISAVLTEPSSRIHQQATSKVPSTESEVILAQARKHLSEQEIQEIEQALKESEPSSSDIGSVTQAMSPSTTADMVMDDNNGFLSPEEAGAIEAALREADAKEEEESIRLALAIQEQELGKLRLHGERNKQLHPQGNVRSMTRAELDYENQRLSDLYENGMANDVADMRVARMHPMSQEEYYDDETAGFRMNSTVSQEWARRDRNTIIGPNNEIRTKHDVHVQGQANAQYLGLDEDGFGVRTHVGNQAFNSFKKNMKRTTKGVATHGTGRAGTDSDAVRGKAMDPHVRLQISKAINSGLIEHCNGEVKRGKEAVVYHAEQGTESQGFDVAVKVFKRMTEFRGRGSYVDGDSRYTRQPFRKNSEREQIEVWTEKEFRNLVRANRSKVPVPTPLHYKENVIFMRFMGNDGWPAPQIREIEMRKGSQKWNILYTQCMEAIRR